jgi:hypothetical protein
MKPLPNKICASATTLLLLAAVLAAASGCSRQAAAKSTALPNTKLESWNWDQYPPVSKMRLGILPCQVQPKSMIAMSSPLMGTLRVYISSPQTNLPAGFLWGEFEPEVFEAEKKALNTAKLKLEEREKIQTEIEIPKQKLQLEKLIEESQRQVALMRLLATNKELAASTISIGSDNNPIRPEGLAKGELELDLLTRSLKYLQATNSALGVDLVSLQNDLERRNLEFDRRQAQSRFTMPFPGRLTVTLPITEGVKEYPVKVGEEIGVARDISVVRLRIAMANLAWTSLPAENMSALVRLPSGEELLGSFAYHKIERVQAREEAAYYFEFPGDKSEMAARLIGSTVSCELWLNLSKPVRVIPKMALIMFKPDALEGRTWSHGLALAFPGSQLVAEGQTDLGVFITPGAPLKM